MSKIILTFVFFAFLRASYALDFNRDVRPILAGQCFACHGMDEHSRKGKLRLDLETGAHGIGKSGEKAIVAGQPEASEIIKRIFSEDEDDLMPPTHTKKVLTAKEKSILKTWVEEGGKYEAHWAYKPPQQRPLPAPGLHPVDAFIRDRLKKEGLSPSAEASPLTLVRRVYLDLIGLPPTPEQADDFVKNCEVKGAAAAYEALVEDLLSSPHYGERWARRWLDLARYADTNGFEKDRPRSIWPYRDWVVKSLNADMPFDQFSIKQLAGDMLPNAQADDWVATGFHRNTMLNEEGGIDPNEYRFYAMVDRVGVTGTTWFGLTLNCAQCHTHKYDPILHTEFYGIMALLNNADEPTYHISTPEIQSAQVAHQKRIQELEQRLPNQYPGGEAARQKAFSTWLAMARAKASDWQILRPKSMKTTMPHLDQLDDGFILGNGDISKSEVYDFELEAPLKNVTALRLEVKSHPSLPNDGPGLTNYEGPIGGFFLSELKASQNQQPVLISRAEATNDTEEDKINDGPTPTTKGKAKAKAASAKKKVNHASAALDSEMSSGWQVLGGYGVEHAAVFHFSQPVDFTKGMQLKMLFEKHFACPLGHFRLSVTTSDHASATGFPADIEETLVKPSSVSQQRLLGYFCETAPEMSQAAAPLLAMRRSLPRGQPTLAMRERPSHQPRKTHRYHRGEYLQPKEEVSPNVPAFLPPLPKDAPANRLTFASWLFNPEHPLTARVTVNRHWQAFFGQGLVRSLDDFGYQSEAPSHPELLDWLALRLIQDGWSLKKLHRLIVTSATYKQTSHITPELASRDPENRLLARGARFRLEAEIIRDSSLKAAGLLSAKMGGPGVYPPQPASVTTEGTYGKVEWKTSEGEDRYRRSLYTFIKRTAPFAMSTTFDAPTGEACLARRDVSNSPLQALTLLNDQMFLEMAQALGKLIHSQPGSDDVKLTLLFRRCITRPPSEVELGHLRTFLQKQRSQKLEGEVLWTAVSRAVMNLDEAITHP